MERVPWITASIKGLTVTGLKAEVGSGGRAGAGRQDGSTAGNVQVQDWTAWTEGFEEA